MSYLGQALGANRLNPAQRQQFQQVRQTAGKQAGRAYRQGILGNQVGQQNIFKGYSNLDPTAVSSADAQYEANLQGAKDTAGMNRVNESNQYGSRQYGYDPTTGRQTITDSLSQPQQNLQNSLWNGQQAAVTQAQGMAPVDPNQAGAARQQVINDTTQQFNTLNDPAFAKQNQDFQQQMADQGIAQGSDEWNKRYQGQVTQPQTLARQQAASAGVQMGGQEQSRLWNQQLQQRQLPFQDAASFAQLGQYIQQPQFQQMGQVQVNPTDVSNYNNAFSLQKRQAADALNLAQVNNGAAMSRAQLAANAAKANAGSGLADPGLTNFDE
jgi:hypothetical protein